ncbi:class I lanthipeptide [Pontimicrobium sp. MEBiC01747]
MKTQKRKLEFNKSDVLELNNSQMLDVNGGTSPTTIACSIIISIIITTIPGDQGPTGDDIFENDFE